MVAQDRGNTVLSSITQALTLLSCVLLFSIISQGNVYLMIVQHEKVSQPQISFRCFFHLLVFTKFCWWWTFKVWKQNVFVLHALLLTCNVTGRKRIRVAMNTDGILGCLERLCYLKTNSQFLKSDCNWFCLFFVFCFLSPLLTSILTYNGA